MPLNLPPFDQAALFLDIDGTLLDFAPTPESVVVPPDLVAVLGRLRSMLGDALALVTGRPVEQAEALFGNAPYAVAGEHGAAIRPAPAAELQRAALPDLPPGWVPAAEGWAAAHPGVRLERKRRGFVLHYRQAPASGEALRAAVSALAETDVRFEVLAAAMAWELRARGVDKGTAVRRLAQSAPFRGRRPVFVGDDVTDEDGIRAAQELGGVGLLVGEVFGSACVVRDWLRRCADLGDWANWR